MNIYVLNSQKTPSISPRDHIHTRTRTLSSPTFFWSEPRVERPLRRSRSSLRSNRTTHRTFASVSQRARTDRAQNHALSMSTARARPSNDRQSPQFSTNHDGCDSNMLYCHNIIKHKKHTHSSPIAQANYAEALISLKQLNYM